MSINQKNFDKKYYYEICFGSEDFKQSKGLKVAPRIKHMIDALNLSKSMDVLEIGCGRGDTALYIAKKVNSVSAIDYSKDGIKIANEIKKNYPKKIQDKTKFYVMDASKLKFKKESFDYVILIDTIEHLNTKEQIRMLNEIQRVLRPNGKLFVRTCTNKILNDFTYKYYSYPVNIFLTWIDKLIKGKNYDSLPKNPRSKEQKKQHINESTYFTLKELFNKTNFSGNIESEIGFLKEGNSQRTRLYNFAIALFPISKHFPLNVFFTSSFICFLQKEKQ